jgi:hypothetical protein
MVGAVQWSFSWWTFAAFVVALTCALLLQSRLKQSHPSIYADFRPQGRWVSSSDQLRFFGFLWTFRYFALGDIALTMLALLTQITTVIAIYLMFAQPIFYRVSSP